MEFDDETLETKTYTTLTNVNAENADDFEFKFEKFLLSGNSDSEDDNADILLSSDDSGSEEENSNFDFSITSETSSSQNFSLTTEDWSVINSSQNPELRKALMMNRNVKYMTLQLFNKIKSLLLANQEKIKTLRKSLEKNESKECSMMLLGQLGAPYFKTKKDMFCSDPNKDALDRRKRGLLTIYQTQAMSSKWSKSECDKLTRGVQLTYNHNKQKAILGEITNLKEKLSREDEDSETAQDITDKIEQLEDEIRELRAIGIDDIPPLSQNKFINWDHIATEFLMDKHNAQECSAFWHIYLHPNINKSKWTNEENEKIRLLAEKYNKQDWDRIAAELGTNRSGFSVFLYYSSSLCDQLPKSRFSEEEDAKLIEYVESRKIGSYIPWNIITEFFPHRTKIQLMHRYKNYLTNLDQYTKGFSDAEDILILILIERFGRNYIKFTKYLPTKSYMQIKSRYDNHLRFKRIKGYFSLEEDQQILSHFSFGNEIGSLTVALNRNRLQIRQRYLKLKEYFEKNPHKTLECLQRKGGKKNETFRRLEFLKCIKDQFKGCVDIPTLEEIEKKLGKNKQSTNDHDIDVMLVNFFHTSYKIKQKPLEIAFPKITQAANQIYNILKSWRVNLEIPEELRKNNTLDVIDVEILSSLRNKYNSDIHRPSIDDLLPPNLNSLIGLRGLLLKNRVFRRSDKKALTLKDNLPIIIRNDKENEIANELLKIFHTKDISTQCIIQNERILFLERFESLFTWPALLSIEPPAATIANIESRPKPERSINKKKAENKVKSKPVKRNIAENSNIPVTKKIKLSGEKQQIKDGPQTSLQPQRFSSRLRNKKQISNKNESTQNGEEVSAGDGTQNLTNSDGRLPNSEDPKKQEQIHEMTKSKNVRIDNRNTKIIPRNLNEIKPQNLPPNLIKVDKSEIVRLLQNKKPIKIFKILSIQKPDRTVTVPNTSNVKITEIVENQNQSNTSSEPSGFVPDIANLKTNLMAKFTKNTNTNNSKTDSNRMKKNLNNSVNKKTALKPISHTNTVPESSVKRELNHAEDLNKLDAFLNNVEIEDYTIDLTESEVMKNEVEQLDQLIKQESTFDLTSI